LRELSLSPNGRVCKVGFGGLGVFEAATLEERNGMEWEYETERERVNLGIRKGRLAGHLDRFYKWRIYTLSWARGRGPDYWSGALTTGLEPWLLVWSPDYWSGARTTGLEPFKFWLRNAGFGKALRIVLVRR